jgi:hypothetical protein
VAFTIFVDAKFGADDPLLAKAEDPERPFRTLGSAIREAEARYDLDRSDRWVVSLSPGRYAEEVTVRTPLALVGAGGVSTEIAGMVRVEALPADSEARIRAVTLTEGVSIDAGRDASVSLREVEVLTVARVDLSSSSSSSSSRAPAAVEILSGSVTATSCTISHAIELASGGGGCVVEGDSSASVDAAAAVAVRGTDARLALQLSQVTLALDPRIDAAKILALLVEGGGSATVSTCECRVECSPEMATSPDALMCVGEGSCARVERGDVSLLSSSSPSLTSQSPVAGLSPPPSAAAAMSVARDTVHELAEKMVSVIVAAVKQ